MFDSVPTSPRSSIPETDIRHRTPVPDNGSWPRKGGGQTHLSGDWSVFGHQYHRHRRQKERSDLDNRGRDRTLAV